MKIAMITTDRQRGGILLAFANYAECIADMGHELVVVAPRDATDMLGQIGRRGVKARATHLMSPAEIGALRRLSLVPSGVRAALAGADVIVSHNNFLCRPLAGLKIPIVSVCHTDRWKGLERSAAILFLSHAVDRLYGEAQKGGRGPTPRTAVVPHFFKASLAENPYRRAQGARFTVSAAGRFVENKGFDDFVTAASTLRREGCAIDFVLAGDGEERANLTAQSAKLGGVVDFTGWVDIAALAARSHVFCLTSDHEPFGYVLCEMMERGAPCVSTDTSGPLEILDGGRAGLVYPAGRADLLAERIRALYQSPELCADYSKRAFERIREADFSEARFVERFEALLQSVRGA